MTVHTGCLQMLTRDTEVKEANTFKMLSRTWKKNKWSQVSGILSYILLIYICLSITNIFHKRKRKVCYQKAVEINLNLETHIIRHGVIRSPRAWISHSWPFASGDLSTEAVTTYVMYLSANLVIYLMDMREFQRKIIPILAYTFPAYQKICNKHST